MKLTVGISTYNAKEHLGVLLSSIQKHVALDHEVIVVDDASTDGTTEWLKEHYPSVRLVENQENKGLAANYKTILQLARGEYIFRLDVDTQVHDRAMQTLVGFLDDHQDVGVVALQIVYPSGVPDYTSYGLNHIGVWQTFKDFSFLFWKAWQKVISFISQPQLPDTPIRVDHVLGAAFIIRARVMEKAGLPDVRVNFFRDETDWQYKIRDAGWEIWYHPGAVITHVGGSSAGSVYIHGKARNLQSMWQFIRNHYPGRMRAVLFLVAILGGSLLSLVTGVVALLVGTVVPGSKGIVIGLKTFRTFGTVIEWHMRHGLTKIKENV